MTPTSNGSISGTISELEAKQDNYLDNVTAPDSILLISEAQSTREVIRATLNKNSLTKQKNIFLMDVVVYLQP